MNNLYKTIELLCFVRGISIGAMCKSAGISQGAITDLKMGRKQTIQIETAAKIANALDVDTNMLMENKIQKSNEEWEDDCWEDWNNAKSDNERIAILKSFGVNAELIPEYKRLFLNKKQPAAKSDEQDILDEVDIAFYGEYKELSDDEKDVVRDMVRVMRERRAKKQGR